MGRLRGIAVRIGSGSTVATLWRDNGGFKDLGKSLFFPKVIRRNADEHPNWRE
jgi:hypothetical protein